MMSATLKILAWWILITTVVSFLIVANVLKLDTYVFQNYKVLFLFVSRQIQQLLCNVKIQVYPAPKSKPRGPSTNYQPQFWGLSELLTFSCNNFMPYPWCNIAIWQPNTTIWRHSTFTDNPIFLSVVLGDSNCCLRSKKYFGLRTQSIYLTPLRPG